MTTDSLFFPSARAEVFLRQGRSRVRHGGGDAHVVIAGRDCLFQVVDVPSTDAAELEGMMALRAEEVSPFPVDRTHWGWEWVAATEAESRVVFVLTGHRVLDALHAEGMAGKGAPERVDVDVLVWWELLKDAEEEASVPGSRLVLLVEEGQSFLLAVEGGALAAVVSLGDPGDCGAEVFGEEVGLALAGIEAERGRLRFEGLAVWVSGDLPAAVDVAGLGRQLGLEAAVRDLGALGGLEAGLERRALVSRTERRLDLSPGVWKAEARARALRKRMVTGALGVGGIWVLLVLGFAGVVWREGRVVSRLEAANAAREEAVAEVMALGERVRSLSQFTDRSTSALEMLRVLAEASPGQGRVLVEDVLYKKEAGVTVSGEATGDFFAFQEALSASPLLRVETFETREVRGQTEFRVESVWSWMAAEEGL